MTIKLNQPYSFSQLGKRSNQEDSRFPASNCPLACDPFFIVCDGVGGEADGEVASRTVCQAMAKVLGRYDWSDRFTQNEFLRALDAAYQALNTASRDASSDMATTLAFAAFHKGGCSMAYIGDSRIYQLRPGQGIIYRSDDHSLVNELVHAGVITPDEALTHPQRSTISRYMAPLVQKEERCQPTWFTTTDVRPGDSFLLCTDGVVDAVSDKMLERIICSPGNDEEKCQKLARCCQGSDDNNTAYLISIAEVSVQPDENKSATEDDEPLGQTRRITGSQPKAVDMEATRKDYTLGERLTNFIKGKFNL